MRNSVLTATLLALAIIAAGTGEQAFAQKSNKKAEKHKNSELGSKGGAGEEDLDAPVDMSKFPGVGSIDSWKTSVPEFREGMNKMKAHSWDEAIAHFRASIALYEYQPRAWLEIGKAIEAKNGLVSDAEKAFRECVKLNNQSWNGWKCLGNNLYVQRRYGEAREAVSNSLQLNPPAKAKTQLEKMVQMIDSAQRDSNTQGQNTAQ